MTVSNGGLSESTSSENLNSWMFMCGHQKGLFTLQRPIMWTILSHNRAGGIVGMHYFSQVSQPVSFVVFVQLPNHSHYSLAQSLHQPISLWVVGHDLQLLHAKDLAHFINYTAHEVSTLFTQKHDWASKD